LTNNTPYAELSRLVTQHPISTGEIVFMARKVLMGLTLCFLIAVTGAIVYAANYTVQGLSFNGVMTGPNDTDWLTLGGQEGANPNVCLSHANGVDFDFAVYNDGREVCKNEDVGARTCCRANTPGSARIKVWSVQGSGNYSISIQP